MKKFFLICVLALLGLIQSVAQEYVPFVREGVQWVCTYNNRPFTLELKGDVVIGGKAYKAMHKYSGDAINTVNDTIPVYLREEGKVVYGIVPDGKTYADCPVGINGDATMTQLIENGVDYEIEYSGIVKLQAGFNVKSGARFSVQRSDY